MKWNLIFIINSILLGTGLAMDAFSVSLANGLNESHMNKRRMCFIAGIYAFFQFAMPMAGWLCVHTILDLFNQLQIFIPWIALFLLLYIGGKMLWEAFHKNEDAHNEIKKLTLRILILQGIATSIDALSVGFAIADYSLLMAFSTSVIIALVTFAICLAGLLIGKRAASHLNKKANILGGLILIGIGIEIFIRGIM